MDLRATLRRVTGRLPAPRGVGAATAAVLAASVMLASGTDVARSVPDDADPTSAPGRPGAEAAALQLATSLTGLPLADGATCPNDRLQVRWRPPLSSYDAGAYVEPLGAPDDDDTRANGLLVCRRSTHAFLGFTAVRGDDGVWRATPVPDPGGEEAHGDEPTAAAPSTALPAGVADVQSDSPWHGRWGPEIEPLAMYEPQSMCDPTPKAGTAAFRALVSRTFPFTRDLGIGRGCANGARSEHKEGRAWDWGVSVDAPFENRAANTLISWLLATDEHGNRFAMARRLGVMYVIWDGHIWNASHSDAGWRPYRGPSPHTDHVHLSFNRAGAVGATSFWRMVPLGASVDLATHFLPRNLDLGGPTPPRDELGPRAGQTAAAPATTTDADDDAGRATPTPDPTTQPPERSSSPAPAPTPTTPTLPPAPEVPTTTLPPPPPVPELPLPVPTTEVPITVPSL